MHTTEHSCFEITGLPVIVIQKWVKTIRQICGAAGAYLKIHRENVGYVSFWNVTVSKLNDRRRRRRWDFWHESLASTIFIIIHHVRHVIHKQNALQCFVELFTCWTSLRPGSECRELTPGQDYDREAMSKYVRSRAFRDNGFQSLGPLLFQKSTFHIISS